MKMKMRDVLGVPNSGPWSGKDFDGKIKVCGARHPLGPRCDEPYWMPAHNWHTAGGWYQWCDCGERHHFTFQCAAAIAVSTQSEETP